MGEGHALIKLKRRKVPVCNLHVTAVATGQSRKTKANGLILVPYGYGDLELVLSQFHSHGTL
jgi:hypothetical protein